MNGSADPSPRPRVAVVLFNLGGPDSPEAVRPFLLNLFTDPAILRVPAFVRPILARIIARARTRPASENYALLGGRSPLLELTERQARALEVALRDQDDPLDVRCFIAMRYWHPFSAEAAADVAAWNPDRIVLLPLYPQYSTTTTGSSLTAWREAAARAGLARPTTTICCWPDDAAYVSATAALIRRSLDDVRDGSLDGQVAQAEPGNGLRVLFSAHGLPEVIVAGGDPYQNQVERSVAALANELGLPSDSWQICYQSRATPQKWLEPSTETALEQAVADGVAALVVPVAFVSEHSETLVELDIEYADMARAKGIRAYVRVPAQNDDPRFVRAMAGLVRQALGNGPGLCSAGQRCPLAFRDCPHRRAALPTAIEDRHAA